MRWGGLPLRFRELARGIRVNALLTLEPRVAGDVVPEPDVEFPGDDSDLHYTVEDPNFCAFTYSWYCTTTHYCG